MFAITTRLLLRPPWPEDASGLYDAANDVRIARNLARLPWPYYRKDAEDFCASAHGTAVPPQLIFDRQSGALRLIGCCELSEREGQIELGYWIRADSWHRGYASEAGRALVDIARALGHERISAGHFIDNPASGAVLRKIGFRETGRIEQRWSEGRGSKVHSRRYCWSRDDRDGDDELHGRCGSEPVAA